MNTGCVDIYICVCVCVCVCVCMHVCIYIHTPLLLKELLINRLFRTPQRCSCDKVPSPCEN